MPLKWITLTLIGLVVGLGSGFWLATRPRNAGGCRKAR